MARLHVHDGCWLQERSNVCIINIPSPLKQILVYKLRTHIKESTLAVFLDIEKAYDMLWRKGIIIKLYTMGIDGRITKWIDNFLTDRKIQIKVNNCLSEERTLDNGVPQGT